MPPTVSGFYRTFLAFVVLTLFILVYRRERLKVVFSVFTNRRVLLPAMLAAACFAADLFVWHKSVIYSGAGVATLLANTQVFYLAFIGFIFFKEKIDLKYISFVLLAFAGIAILVFTRESSHEWPHYGLGVWLGFLTGGFYSSYILSMRNLEKKISTLYLDEKILIVSLLTSMFLAVFLLIEGGSLYLSDSDWLWAILLALVPQVFGWILITKSLPRVSVSLTGLILLLQPVLSIVWGVLLLNEPMNLIQAFGVIMTLFAILAGERYRQKRLTQIPENIK